MSKPERSQIGARTSMRKLLETPLMSSIPSNLTADGVESLQKIDTCICSFLQFCNPTIREKVVLLINHIIIMDKLAECSKTAWENDSRHRYMHDMLDLLHEFGLRSSSLSLKESVYYYAACLCFKVHDYTTALYWFNQSKSVYVLDSAGNELSEIERQRRDIFIAFCHEYIGEPEASIVFLLGITSIDIFEAAIFAHRIDIAYAIGSFESKKDKYHLIKTILSFAEFNNGNILKASVDKINPATATTEQEMDELIHVFSHCLSEYKIKTDNFEEEKYGKIKFINLIRLISTKLIDTLDNKYITCKATIRAEGNDRDGALEILPDDDAVTGPKELAEVNFYRFYFTELFSGMFASQDDDAISVSGQAFKKYCNDPESKLDDESKRDALLHYHIFEVKRTLRTQFEKIIKAKKNRNSSFFALDFEKIGEPWKESFYAITQKTPEFRDGFSYFANSEIKKELHLLHICLNILLEMKANGLPLFFSNDEDEREFNFETNGNQLFELCKMFSSIFLNGNRQVLQSYNVSSSKYRTYYINNLRFDIITDDYNSFDEWIQKLFDGEQVDYSQVELTDQTSTTKIVYGKSETVEDQCEQYNQQLTHNSNLNIRVFYVGERNDTFLATPIVAFKDLKICILMAFIYATIESVLDYICNPRPIYILAPLRDTGSYYFQAVNLDRFIPLHYESSEERKINSEGIGITPRYSAAKVNVELTCNFGNDEIKKACCCAIKYSNNKLLVLRENEFIEKTNVNHQLIKYCYIEYTKKREKCRKCSFVHNNEQTSCGINNTLFCDYVFRKSDALANARASMNPIAQSLLLELIVIACKEDVYDYDNLFVLENSLVAGVDTNNPCFIIYLFTKDIGVYGCCKNWLQVGESIVSVDEADIIEAINYSKTKTESQETINYRAYVCSICNAFESRRSGYAENWSKYRTRTTGTALTTADNKIKELNELQSIIASFKALWIAKDPSNKSDAETEKTTFTSCTEYTKIFNTLKDTAYETEE